MSPPDPRDGGRMDAHFLGHETATPVRGVCGLLLEGLADDLRFVVRSDLAGSTRAWSVLEQLFTATCLVPVEPLRDRRPRYAHLPADRRPRPSLGRAENDVGPFDHALRGGPFVHQSLQAPAFSSAQPNPTHWKSHARNLSHVSIGKKISATLH